MGCRTEPAAVHIAHVLQRLHFFQFFNLTIIYTTYRKNKKIHFFYNSHDLQQKKKLHAFTEKKLHGYTVFLYTTYIFQHPKTFKNGFPTPKIGGGCLTPQKPMK